MNDTLPALNPVERAAMLDVARAAITARLEGSDALRVVLDRLEPTAALVERNGLFVTLNEDDAVGAPSLRGCVGTMHGNKPLYLEVADTACSAAFDDPRFPPLTVDELDRVRLSISVLSELRPVVDWRRIEPGVDGVQLVRDARRSVFLPHVAIAQGWDRERMLEQLALKAGLAADGWRTAELFTFRAQSFEEARAGQAGG